MQLNALMQLHKAHTNYKCNLTHYTDKNTYGNHIELKAHMQPNVLPLCNQTSAQKQLNALTVN